MLTVEANTSICQQTEIAESFGELVQSRTALLNRDNAVRVGTHLFTRGDAIAQQTIKAAARCES